MEATSTERKSIDIQATAHLQAPQGYIAGQLPAAHALSGCDCDSVVGNWKNKSRESVKAGRLVVRTWEYQCSIS